VTVTVDQTVTNISVTPPSMALSALATQQFTATAIDQFWSNADDSAIVCVVACRWE